MNKMSVDISLLIRIIRELESFYIYVCITQKLIMYLLLWFTGYVL